MGDIFPCHIVSSNRLDIWHTKVEDILPSFILNMEDIKNEYFAVDIITKIELYYKGLPSFIVDLIENAFWIGISNLYSGYKSQETLKYLKLVIKKMTEKHLVLPDFEIVSKCSAMQRHGWGEHDDLNNYLNSP